MRVIHRRSLFSKITGSSVVSILWIALLIALISGCGSSSDTQTAVRNATSVDLVVYITNPPTSTTVALGASIDFMATASGGSGDYTLSWTIPGANLTNSENGVNAVFTTEGTHTVKVTATDSLGNTASNTVKITVTGSTLSATITAPATNITITAGDEVSFAGQATGGAPGSYSYGWTIPGSDTPSASGDSVDDVTFNTAGTYIVVLRITDSVADMATDAIVVTVEAASSTATLAASISSPGSDQNINTGDSVSFSGKVTGGTGSYSYAWDIPGGSTTSSTSQSVSNVTFNSDGVYVVTFTATDSAGSSDSDTVTITVSESTLAATITNPSADYTIAQADATATGINFKVIATGGSSSYTYSWDFPNSSNTTSATTQSVTGVKWTSKGTYPVSVTVTDSNGNSVTTTRSITVN